MAKNNWKMWVAVTPLCVMISIPVFMLAAKKGSGDTLGAMSGPLGQYTAKAVIPKFGEPEHVAPELYEGALSVEANALPSGSERKDSAEDGAAKQGNATRISEAEGVQGSAGSNDAPGTLSPGAAGPVSAPGYAGTGLPGKSRGTPAGKAPNGLGRQSAALASKSSAAGFRRHLAKGGFLAGTENSSASGGGLSGAQSGGPGSMPGGNAGDADVSEGPAAGESDPNIRVPPAAQDDKKIVRACVNLVPAKNNNHTGRGNLMCWITAGGKHVFQFDDGMFADGNWRKPAERALPGAAQLFADKFGDDNIIGKQVTGYKATPLSYMPEHGTYVETGGPSRIPDRVQWEIFIQGGYKMEFAHSSTRDCIYSGNGVYYLSGNGNTVAIPAQTGSYKGMVTCIRCHMDQK